MRRAALLALAACAACAHAPARERAAARVEAEGWAPLAGDPLAARRAALADAERAAVEAATGVALSARTRVDGAVAVDARVEAAVAGRVLRSEVLSERDEGGFHKTRIRAWVESPAPGETPGPRPAVALALTGPDADAAAEGARRALRARGFAVVAEKSAELVVEGDASARSLGGIGPFLSWRARAGLRLRRRGGEELARESREASGVDPSADGAERRAAENAGELAAVALADAAFPR